MRIGKCFKHHCEPLTVCNDSLQFVSEMKYLGVYISAGTHFSFNITKLKTKFYAALNGILSKCRNSMNEMVTLRLVNAFCRPILLYGCDCVPLCKTFIDSLTHSWNRIYYKVFKVSDTENISAIQSYMNDTAINDDICKCRKRFLSRIKCSNNSVMCTLALAIIV